MTASSTRRAADELNGLEHRSCRYNWAYKARPGWIRPNQTATKQGKMIFSPIIDCQDLVKKVTITSNCAKLAASLWSAEKLTLCGFCCLHFFTLSWRPWKLMGPVAIVIEVAHESFLGGDVFLSEHAVLALDCKEVFWASCALDCKDVAWLYFRASNMLVNYSNIKFMYLLYTLDEHHTIYIISIYYIYKWLVWSGH